MSYLSFEWKYLKKIGFALFVSSIVILGCVLLYTKIPNYALTNAKGLDMLFVPLEVGLIYQINSTIVYHRFYERKHKKLEPLLIASKMQIAMLPFILKLLNGVYTLGLMFMALHIIALGLGKPDGMFTVFPDENFIMNMTVFYAFEIILFLDVKLCMLYMKLKSIKEQTMIKFLIAIVGTAAFCYIIGVFAFTDSFSIILWIVFVVLILLYGIELVKLKKRGA